MATKEQLDRDRLRVEVARLVEDALGCPGGIMSYFDNIPEDDEEPGGDGDEITWNHDPDDDTEDAVYRVAADAVFGLEAGITVKEGFMRAVNTVRDVADKFEAARYLLQEKEATLD